MSQAIESFIEEKVRKIVNEHLSKLDMSAFKRQSLVVANWKMNMELQNVYDFVNKFYYNDENIVICPPFPYLFPLKSLLREKKLMVSLGAQNVHWETSGAYTGEVSAGQLKDIGCTYVIIGHSERRAAGETNKIVNQKVSSALLGGLKPIICVGETKDQRDKMETVSVITNQIISALNGITDLSNIVIAYEPVWAIGTGESASVEQAEEVHQVIRSLLMQRDAEIGQEVPILYGGSIKPSNVAQFANRKNINGVLVGGASLQAEDFLAIAEAFL